MIYTQEEFIRKCKSVHGDTYDYSKTVYTRSYNKVVIICRTHGEFIQVASSHASGHGCCKCGKINMGYKARLTTDAFIEKAKNKHGNRYDYSLVDYTRTDHKIKIICSIHGIFEQNPYNHLNGAGCHKCSRVTAYNKNVKKIDQFLQEAILIHGYKYNYSKVKYVRSGDKIEIICPKHGSFFQAPISHTRGFGCLECMLEISSFKKQDWIDNAKGRLGKFYIIRCYNDSESFYKYGITIRSIKNRYTKDAMPYNYEIVRIIISSDLEYIWDLEKRFGNFKKNNRYSPQIKFNGCYRECFKSYATTSRTR